MSNKITAFPAKKPLTNAAFWRIIKVKRGHTSRRSAPMLSYQEITVQVSSSGRLFPFIVVVMENIVHQCYNSNDQDTVLNQIWPSYIFHITHSLSGSRNRPARRPAEMATADSPKDSKPPTVSGMPSVFYYITLREKCQTIVYAVFRKNKYRLSAIVKQKQTWQTSKNRV